MTKTERKMYRYALSYALTRHNSAMTDCVEAFKDVISEFETWEIDQMINDVKAHWRVVEELKKDSLNRALESINLAEQKAFVNMCLEELHKRAGGKNND